jgi:DNA repair exonuclease SbcCD ATPase subunit
MGWKPYTSNTTSGTQDTIHELLGLSQDEIKLLSYFSAKAPSLYGTLTKSTRYDLISTIAGMSDVDKARDIITDLHAKTSRERITSESAISTLKNVEASSKARIKDFLSRKDTRVSVNTQAIESLKLEAEEQIKKSRDEKELRELIGECYKKYNEYQRELSKLNTSVHQLNFEYESINSSITSNRDKLKKALQGKCPTCGQSLHDENVVNDLTHLLSQLQDRLPDMSIAFSHRKKIGDIQVNIEDSEALRALREKELENLQYWKGQLSLYEKKLAEVNKEKVDYDSLINEEMKNREELENKIKLEEFKLEEISDKESAQNWIKLTLLKRNGLLITELSKQGKKILQEQINELTYGEDIEVLVQDDLSVSAKFLKRKEGDYESLSTGQSRVVDIVMMVALNNVFMKFYGLETGPLGLVIFDEVLSFLDEEYVDLCYELIQKTNVPKRIVITHDTKLISRFNSQINVSLKGETSSTYKKNWSSQ